MKCKNCGNKVDKSGAFCEKCGTPVEKKSKTPLYIGLIAGIIVLAIVAVVGILVYNTGAYDRQIELGYELLNDGKYEEAILAFDKAIEIEEKRPEGYMGKAESMAHDPEMTPEKAGEIVKVLEEGYKKSGDKKVLEHKKKVGEILRENGFEEAANIVESAGEKKDETSSREMKAYDYIAFFGDKAVETAGKGLYIRNLETDKRELVFEGTVGSSFVTDGETVYIVKEDTDELYKIDLKTRSSEKLINFEPSEEMREYLEGETPPGEDIKKYTTLEMLAYAGDYIYFLDAGFCSDNFCYNVKTNTYEPSKISVYGPRMVSYKDKIYYDEDFADTSCDPIYMANADGSGETIIEKHILNFKVKGNKMYILCTDSEDGYLTGDFGRTFYKEYNMDTGEKKEIPEEKIYSVAGFGLDYGSNYDYENPEYWATVKGGVKKTGKGNIRGNDARSFFTTTEEVLVVSDDNEDSYKSTLLFDDKMSSSFELSNYDGIVGYNDGKVYYYNGDHLSYEIECMELSFEKYEDEAKDKASSDKAFKKAYSDLIDLYKEAEEKDFDSEFMEKNKISTIVSIGNANDVEINLFYTLKDINGDKIPEIFISGKNVEDDGNIDYDIYDMCTVNSDGKLVHLIDTNSAGYRSLYFIGKNNFIIHTGSSSGFHSYFEVYKLGSNHEFEYVKGISHSTWDGEDKYTMAIGEEDGISATKEDWDNLEKEYPIDTEIDWISIENISALQ